jgi:O-antigen ligase
MLGGLMGLLFLLAVGYFVTRGDNATESGSIGGALARKGIENTRTDLWQARLEEFKSSPVFGIGVAMGTGSGSVIEASGSIRVEPGSSYLAVLAMTGGLGAIAFFSAMGWLVYGFITVQRKMPLKQDILSAAGIFLAVHGVAEGWILGFGSPLCFLFWLWLGNVGDFALQPARARIKRGLREVRRVVPSKPVLANT